MMRYAAGLRAFGLMAFTSLTCITDAADAQGVTSAGIQGKVTAGQPTTDVRILVRQDSTGYSVELPVRRGRFLIQNLEPGGPYTVTARAIGFAPARRRNVFLSLGELRQVNFVLTPVATTLDTVTIVASDDILHRGVHADGGTGMSIQAAQLDRLPTLNRDLYDFVRLVPQISTKISLASPGFSAGGTGFRFNNSLINGLSDRTLSGNATNAPAGGKSIPLDAVREYQVLLAPYDVRYGEFAGALVNAVTKSGTNDLRGSAFVYGRSDALARQDPSGSIAQYERVQYGFSLGGPIIRDRVHFFIAPELQHFTYPAPGPYVGQPADAHPVVPVNAADLERFDSLIRSYGMTAGSAGPVENSNPLQNLYARVDFAFPSVNTRAVISFNHSGSSNLAFSRAARDTFSLSSYLANSKARSRTLAARVHTSLRRAGGGDNELLMSVRRDGLESITPRQQPAIRVSVPSASGGRVTLNSGTNETAQGNPIGASSLSVKDNLTLVLDASHALTVGAEIERFRVARGITPLSFGAWSFANLEDLALGVADRYDVRIGAEPSDVPITGGQYAAYASDRWQPVDRLTITAGIRGDVLDIDGHAPYRGVIDSLFGRRTDAMPRSRVELSPRLGFRWNLTGENSDQVRGGIGIFTGRYPLSWAQTMLTAYGVGGTLSCSRSGAGRGLPPAFKPDHRDPPTACLGGGTITEQFPGDVDLLDRDLRMMRVLRGSIAYDRQLSRSVTFTNEGLFSRGLSDFVVVNLNLGEPVGSDLNGRVIYGTIAANGASLPVTRSPFSEVVEIRNTSRNYSYSLSSRIEKKQANGLSSFASYTWSRTRDVQTPTRVNTRGTVLWGSARVTSGRHDRLTADISSNDIPHRIIVAGTYARPWLGGRTDLSFYYVGESGRPFTYVAFGAQRRGDLNADGSNANDPVYVPKDAGDTSEIHFSGVSDSLGADNSPAAQAVRAGAQRSAFESLIRRTPCMRDQRGRILARNSCREPWSNTTIASLRQAIPVAGRSLEIQVDAFNVLNLLHGAWGQRREAATALLEHVGQISPQTLTSSPVFRFNSGNPDWATSAVESSFQLQLAIRYRL